MAAFEAFFSSLPDDTDPGMAFVLVQHLAPDHKSILADLIRRYNRMQAFEVEGGMVMAQSIASTGFDGMPRSAIRGSGMGLTIVEMTSAARSSQSPGDKFSILYDIALTVGSSLELKRILDDVLDRIIRFMSVDAGVIYVVDDATMEMIPIAFRNLLEEVVRDLSEKKVRVGECMCGTIAQCNQEVIITERASEDPRFTRGVLKKEGMEFYAGLPILAKGKVVGVLCVITHVPYDLDRELLDILRAATQPIGLAIENARIFETVRKEAEARTRYFNFEGIITRSPKMAAILSLVRKITDVPSSILIYGESGTGKDDLTVELLERADDAKRDLSLKSVEKGHILHVLKLTGGNKKLAARELGVNAATLWRKLKSFEQSP